MSKISKTKLLKIIEDLPFSFFSVNIAFSPNSETEKNSPIRPDDVFRVRLDGRVEKLEMTLTAEEVVYPEERLDRLIAWNVVKDRYDIKL